MGRKELSEVRIQARRRIEEAVVWGLEVRKMTREAESGLGFGWKRRKEKAVERGGIRVGGQQEEEESGGKERGG